MIKQYLKFGEEAKENKLVRKTAQNIFQLLQKKKIKSFSFVRKMQFKLQIITKM